MFYYKRQFRHLLAVVTRLLKAEAARAKEVLHAIVVDDSALMRNAIKDALEAICGCDVVGEGVNGVEALELVRLYLPDLVILDINMPVMGGMEALGLLKKEQQEVHVVMVSSVLEKEHREYALGLGAYSCVEKGSELWERLPGIVEELSRKCLVKT